MDTGRTSKLHTIPSQAQNQTHNHCTEPPHKASLLCSPPGTKHKLMLEGHSVLPRRRGKVVAARAGCKSKRLASKGSVGVATKSFQCEVCEISVNSETQLSQVGAPPGPDTTAVCAAQSVAQRKKMFYEMFHAVTRLLGFHAWCWSCECKSIKVQLVAREQKMPAATCDSMSKFYLLVVYSGSLLHSESPTLTLTG